MTGSNTESFATPCTIESLFRNIAGLSNGELTCMLEQLNQRKHTLDAELLLHLSLFEQRGVYRNLESSLFTYCVRRLGFSEDVAYKRVVVARMLRRFPVIYELLVQGRIHLSALILLRPLLTEENHEELLRLACGLSKRAVELLVATRAPQHNVPTKVRKLPEPRLVHPEDPSSAGEAPPATHPSLSPALATSSGTNQPASVVQELPAAPPWQSSPRAQRTRVAPLSSCTYRVVFTASDRLKQKLDRAQELASHAVSPSDLPGLLERALDLLIEREERRRFAGGETNHHRSRASQPQTADSELHPNSESSVPEQTGIPSRAPELARPRPEAKHSRYIPARVRREVWERDQGCCAFVDAEGCRCKERHFVQFEHKIPHALNGPATVENCELLCATHNALRAEQVFGHKATTERIIRNMAR